MACDPSSHFKRQHARETESSCEFILTADAYKQVSTERFNNRIMKSRTHLRDLLIGTVRPGAIRQQRD
jgi:hypothetical protein